MKQSFATGVQSSLVLPNRSPVLNSLASVIVVSKERSHIHSNSGCIHQGRHHDPALRNVHTVGRSKVLILTTKSAIVFLHSVCTPARMTVYQRCANQYAQQSKPEACSLASLSRTSLIGSGMYERDAGHDLVEKGGADKAIVHGRCAESRRLAGPSLAPSSSTIELQYRTAGSPLLTSQLRASSALASSLIMKVNIWLPASRPACVWR